MIDYQDMSWIERLGKLMRSTKLKKWLLLFFCCFPFVGLNFGTDVQPFALIVSVIVIITCGKLQIKYKTCMILYCLVVIGVALVSIYYLPFYVVAKRLFSYVSIALIPMAIDNSQIDINGKWFEKTLKLFMFVWLLVGFVQTFVSREFFHGIVPLMRTDPTRGVTSLANEPSFYGYMCFFFFLLAKDFKTNRSFFMGMQIFQTVLLAKSSVTVIYFVIYFSFYVLYMRVRLKKKDVFKIIFCIAIVSVGVIYVMKQNSHSRIWFLLKNLIDGNIMVWRTDGSINIRLNAIIQSFSRLGIPSLIGENRSVAMSGFGGVFYELGIFSLFLYFMIWKRILGAYGKEEKWVMFWSVTVCMFSGIQLSAPIFSFFLGCCNHRGNLAKHKRL